MLKPGSVMLGFSIATDALIAAMSCYLLYKKRNNFIQ
jgi:hypothetical protein